MNYEKIQFEREIIDVVRSFNHLKNISHTDQFWLQLLKKIWL
jgi:hypothetical protein